MVDFKLRFLDHQGRPFGITERDFPDDAAAVAGVMETYPNRPVELWQADRCIRVFDHGIGIAHARMRAATKSLHNALDTSFELSSLTDREAYSRYLQMNRPCCGIELALEAVDVWRILPDWDQRRRQVALTRDLTSVGAPTIPFPPYSIAPDIGSILGWCYVLEGSRLGAQVVLQTVGASRDAEVRNATCFLRHGAGKPLWRSFKTALSQIDDNEAAILRACGAAKSAFEAFLPGRSASAA
jgi:heme oxygenase